MRNLTGPPKNPFTGFFDAHKLVGLSGIEPDLNAPHALVLPVYYSPKFMVKL